MSSSQRPRVGLLSIISPEKGWPKDGLIQAKKFLESAKKALTSMDFEVIDCGEITRSHQQAASHAREIAYRRAEVLVMYISGWCYSSAVVAAGSEAHLPVIIWTDSRPDTGGLIGAAISKGALDEVGIHNRFIYGGFDNEQVLSGLRKLCIASFAASSLRGQTYGVCGGRSLGMYTGVVDPNEWRVKFGLEVDVFDQLEVMERAKLISEDKAQSYLDWMKAEFGKVAVKDEVMLASIKLYLATKELIKEKGYDFVAVRCLPEMATYYTTFCVAHALLNDDSDAEGEKERIVCACEADSNGALTMQLLKQVTLGSEPIGFSDVRHLDLKENILWISNCGSQPTQFAKTRKDVHWVPHCISEFKLKIGAACPQYISKPGRVTLARLSRVKGNYVMLVTRGNALDFPREKLKETFWEFSPHAFIKLDCSPENFLAEIRSNHIHMVYGDYVEELLEVCSILDIKPMLL